MRAFYRSLGMAALAAVLGFGTDKALAADTTFFVILNGGNEVSGAGQANAGHQEAYGSATVVFRNNQRLCYAIVVMAMDAPTAAHIHRGRAGVNGGIVVPLNPPNAGNLGHVSGCAAVDAAIGNEIRSNPASFYVNVHSGQFPGGAVRGQLF
jgi:hypothetical protein